MTKGVKAPNRFVWHLKSQALRSLVQRVWERIPTDARASIDDRLEGVYAGDLAGRVEALERAGGALVGGVEAMRAVGVQRQ